MTVASTTQKVTYAGNGVTTVFAIPFSFFENSNVVVYLRNENVSPITETLQVITTNYTLTGGTPPTDVTMVIAPPTGTKLIILRILSLTQLLDLIVSGTINPESVEDALDRYIMITHQLSEKLGRAALLIQTSPTTGLVIPEPEADRLLAWNSAATNLINLPTQTSTPLVFRAGTSAIGLAATTVSPVFSSAFADTNYSAICTLRNTVDASPDFQPITITTKVATGFTASWNAPTPTANYVLEWLGIKFL